MQAAGAEITGLGTDTLEITGVEQLGGACHRVIPDRIEAATLLLAAAMTQGTTSVVGTRADHLSAVLDALEAMGVDVARSPHKITVHAGERPRPVDLVARPYPGIPSDLQAQMMALLALADGRSTVADAVFPERFAHVAELNRLGARIQRRGRAATVCGVRRLSGAEVTAWDLRASAALVLAGLAASHETTVYRLDHLDRGYERLDQKLAQLGAQIVRQGVTASEVVAPEVVVPWRSSLASPEVQMRYDAPHRSILRRPAEPV